MASIEIICLAIILACSIGGLALKSIPLHVGSLIAATVALIVRFVH